MPRSRAGERPDGCRQTPLTATQAPLLPATPLATKMIGAKHGLGSWTFASISALPSGPAGTGAVETFVVTAAPLASVDMQLTVTLKNGTGFLPAMSLLAKAGSMTSPSTDTPTSPSARSRASDSPTTHGAPPPGIPRMALVPPVYGALTPTSTLDLKTVSFL